MIAGLAASCAKPVSACSSLAKFANSSLDASGALIDCIKKTAHGGRLELPPATYVVRRQVRIVKPLIIATAGVADSAPGCDRLGAGRCATIRIDLDGSLNPNIMPVEVAANGISLIHLVVEGSTNSMRRADCSQADRRPLGGGLRVLGSNFVLRKSLLRNFTCYTTMEVLAGSNALTIEDNFIGPNGDHRPGEIWSDGITIHDSEDSVVRRNVFSDNTDVQLILGGCRRCRIESNQFRHSGVFAKASFAELMLQAFPSTSGDYTGTVVTGNRIDCGKSRRCGYGIMVGANPWKAGDNPRYPGAMFGGKITGNVVSNALIGINVDAPTGPVEIHGNTVQTSGGTHRSDCGMRNWPAVNMGPGAAKWVRGDPSNQAEGQASTSGCILNRQSD
ncbi:MAG: right-handed parallel beta-helix repeat-containing protein [Sphingomonas sp.]|uniref:right-handed parallel beta-helix repeat-containing protein n=1 Tax=Sphingomonas sp. TaxID=28214 RepID=UPI001835A190|nr:right-handed parallel beta-helix repeat-containing protein [Sphingomonas sp.]MBA3666788.1 right-handed parallel beta-helix repeat-containing protein [Sphingomonas sp.]